MRRAFAQTVVVAALISVLAGGCDWFESSAAADRKADDALGRGEWDLAIGKYSKVIAKKPRYSKAWRRRGYCWLQKGETAKAQADMEQAMQLDPKYAGTHFLMGNSLSNQWKLDQAVKQFEAALAAEPKHAETAAFHAGLALALAGQGRIDEAADHARLAIQANPSNLGAHYVLACGLAAHNQARQAEEEFRRALDAVQPSESPDVDNNRAFIMATCPVASLRNASEAVKLAERADKKTGGRQPYILDTLAAAYAEAGRFDEAVATAKKAIDLAAAQDSPEMVRLMRLRLALYEAHKPLREPAGR